MIYREFWYFSRIFPTLFSQLISIFMSLLHTFSKGVKIDARLPRSERFASIMRSCVLSASCDTRRRIRPLQTWEWSRFEHTSSLTFFNPGVPPIFLNGACAYRRARRRTPLRIMEANRSLLGSRASIFTPLENVSRRLMNMLMSWENKVGKIREKYQNSL